MVDEKENRAGMIRILEDEMVKEMTKKIGGFKKVNYIKKMPNTEFLISQTIMNKYQRKL